MESYAHKSFKNLKSEDMQQILRQSGGSASCKHSHAMNEKLRRISQQGASQHHSKEKRHSGTPSTQISQTTNSAASSSSSNAQQL
jgi:hypothetical protein